MLTVNNLVTINRRISLKVMVEISKFVQHYSGSPNEESSYPTTF